MTTDVEKIKKKQKLLISQVDARMQSRFMKGNYLPTLQIIASSKNSDQSFLDSYINTKKKNNSKTTLIIDEPQWVVRNDKQSDKKFYVAVGNKFLASEVLPLDAPETVVESFRAKGYQMLEVPSGYYENFIDNVDLALTDIAGISSTSALKYISGVRLNETKITNYKNPMTKEIIEVGTGDNIQYSQFFDLNSVPSTLKVKPLYIHLDMSKKGDRTGIAGVWIMGKRAGTSERKGDSEAYYRVAFAFAVQAPKGYEISFEKNRNFIRWLKSQGFKIAGISADTFQSTQIMQQLQADGFNTKTISVDRLENIQGTNTKVCVPYAFFKTAIYEKRIEIFQKCDLLTNEIVNLERESDGHIDHPDGGTSGCFVGSTKVRLVDGRSLTMRELVDEYESGKENWVYSFNEETMKIEPKRIRKAWLTLKDAPLVKVTLDNGEGILCTPNHKFMLRDGSFCEAQDLISGVSLMPLYTKISNKGLKGYRLLYEPMEDKWHWEHRQFATEICDERYLVHHKNCNPLDNTPTNLIWMSKQAHYEEHKRISTGTHSEEANEKRKKSIKEWHEKNRGTAIYEQRSKRLSMVGLGATTEQEWEEKKKERAAQKEATRLHGEELKRVAEENRMAKENRKREIEELFGIDDYNSLSISEKNSLGVKFSRIKDPTIIERTSVALSIAHKEGKFKNAEEALRAYNESMRGKKRSPEDLEKIREGTKNRKFTITDETKRKMSEATKRKRWYTDGETNIYIDKDADIPDGFTPGRTKTWKNHKVLKVEKVDFQEDVFDLEIEDNHNFALDAGVFVHNSKDIADAVCGSTYFASQNIEQFAYNYGEDLDYTLQTNKLNASSSEVKKQVNIAFEQELQNLLTPQSIKREQEEEKKRINNSPYGNRPIVTNGMLIW